VKALVALDAWKGKEAELKGKKLPELKTIWAEAQKQPEAQGPSAAEGAPTEDADTES